MIAMPRLIAAQTSKVSLTSIEAEPSLLADSAPGENRTDRVDAAPITRDRTQFSPPLETFGMKRAEYLPYRVDIEQYRRQCEQLFERLTSDEEAAEWRFKSMHPRFRGKRVADVRGATLELADAEVVLAREYFFENWNELEAFANVVNAEVGLQVALAETLIDHGAAVIGPGTRWQSGVMTALAFGYLETAQALARRSPPTDDLAPAAGLGRIADVVRLLPNADAERKQIALALASQHGHAEVVRLLLEAGVDPNKFNPEGFHAGSTPLHQAVWENHADVVRLLVERGARLDIRDTDHMGTALDWATYGRRTEISDYLRSQGATES
jgi:ankyrin repeat protein